MTLAEAGEIFRYWEENPPPHLLLQAIARMLGWQPHSPGGDVPRSEEIIAAAPPGLSIARGAGIGMPPPLDAAALRDRNRALAAAITHRDQSQAGR